MGVGFCGDVITGLRGTVALLGTTVTCVKDRETIPTWYAGAQLICTLAHSSAAGDLHGLQHGFRVLEWAI
jgi:hypothetical protein